MPLTGVHNENEFYSHHYLSEIFAGDIQATSNAGASGPGYNIFGWIRI